MEDESVYRDKLYNQIQEEYGRLTYTYTTHNKETGILKRNHKRLRVAEIVLSAVTSAGVFGVIFWDTHWVKGASVVVSFLTIVVQAFLNGRKYEAEIQQHIGAANALWLLREEYLSLMTDFERIDVESAARKRNELQRRTAEIYNMTHKTSAEAYALAQKALKEDEEQFFSQEELNRMLPEKLRK